jgi:spore maturation protein CgeB
MKILAVVSTLNLKYRMGCTPHWWMLFKAMYQQGHEVIAIPYLGDPIESLWWRTYPNPLANESKIYNKFLDWKKSKGNLNKHNVESEGSLFTKYSEKYIKGKWEKHLKMVLDEEKDVEAIIFFNVPINHISGLSDKIRSEYSIPVTYFEGDMPIALPKYVKNSNYKFHYYDNADLSEFDAFFSNSKGVEEDLKELGAKNITPIYWAIDPELYKPRELEKKYDISFFGFGEAYREEWIEKMITIPSKKLKNVNFMTGGGFGVDLGNSNTTGHLSFSAFRDFCCQSKICLNITRKTHAEVYATASARPFELAGYGACLISNPVNGIEEWFEPGKEVIIINDVKEAIEVYENLLEDDKERIKIHKRALKRALKDHTYENRANKMIITLYR